MSTDSAAEAADSCCANCGVKATNIKLKKCGACGGSVRYCSIACQKKHWPKHKRACKQRAAELREEILFRQNDSSYLGDCPICCLPIPLDKKKFGLQACCGKYICQGCNYANQLFEVKEKLKQHRCPFCRKPLPKTKDEGKVHLIKRAAANDPVALRTMGKADYDEGDYDSAFGYFTRAAALGEAEAHYNLSILYQNGNGVQKDRKLEIYHLEEAAIIGYPEARYQLGLFDGKYKRFDRAIKHFIIAANLGHYESLQKLKECYKGGLVSKDDLATALRAHQAAVDATKSPQREEAAEASFCL